MWYSPKKSCIPAKKCGIPPKKCGIPKNKCCIPSKNVVFPQKICGIPPKQCGIPPKMWYSTKNMVFPKKGGIPQNGCLKMWVFPQHKVHKSGQSIAMDSPASNERPAIFQRFQNVKQTT
jgi:hypothetical protein